MDLNFRFKSSGRAEKENRIKLLRILVTKFEKSHHFGYSLAVS